MTKMGTKTGAKAGPAAGAQGLVGEARRMKILEWMQEEGSARVRALAVAFAVSEVTVRQDLEKLESEGHIVRAHGGAYLRSMPQQVREMALHHLVNMDAKRRIGRAAAALVNDGETIIIDSGSTTTELASNLLQRENLTIITNALNVALMLGALPSVVIHMPGGKFKAPTLSLSGERSADYFQGLYAQKLFLATAAVSIEEGLTFPALSDISVKRGMIGAASRIILLADSSKIGKRSFSTLCGIDEIGTLVTDDGLTDADHRRLTEAGVEVIVA
jgi:DeoR/GlpR family transcriptional regulator of sugar metabolism